MNNLRMIELMRRGVARVRLHRHVLAAAGVAGMLAAALVSAPTSVPAQSRDLQILADSVRRLELQVSVLQRQVDQGGGSPTLLSVAPDGPASLPDLLIRLAEMEQVLRSVTGRLEQLENEVARQASLIDRLANDFDFRLRILEEGRQGAAATGPDVASGAAGAAAAAPGGPASAPRPVAPPATPPAGGPAPAQAGPPTPPQTASAGPTVALPAGSPQEQYNFAYDFLLRGRYGDAQLAFQAFIAANPDHPLAGNSQYWLGETYFARSQYDAAARAFARGFERYPDSDKVTHNLLKLGMSLAQLDQHDNACDTIDLLIAEYPQAPTSVRDRANQERQALGC